MAPPGAPLSHETIDRRGSTERWSQLGDLGPSIGNDERLAQASSSRVPAEVLAHLPNTDTLHVRHCSAHTFTVVVRRFAPLSGWLFHRQDHG